MRWFYLFCLFVSFSLTSCRVGKTFAVVGHSDTVYVNRTDTFLMYKDRDIHDSIVDVIYIDRETHDTVFRDRYRSKEVHDTVFLASRSVSDSIQSSNTVTEEKPSVTRKSGKFWKFIGKIVFWMIPMIILLLFLRRFRWWR